MLVTTLSRHNMPSPLFLSSYCLFKSALQAFLQTPEGVGLALHERDVMSAFKCATQGLPPREEKEFLEFAQGILRMPGTVKEAAFRQRMVQWRLDLAISTNGENLIDDGSIIFIDEFLLRTGLSEEVFAQKLKDRKIFKMPSSVQFVWARTYLPAFFADTKFDLSALERVSQALRTCNGIEKYRFFTTAVVALGNQTPLDAIAAGGIERVLDEVKLFRRALRRLASRDGYNA
jgi:hypothetical protein